MKLKEIYTTVVANHVRHVPSKIAENWFASYIGAFTCINVRSIYYGHHI